MTIRRSLALAVLSLLVSSQAWASYEPATLLFRFRDAEIAESSGVAPGTQPGITWTHNDSQDRARFFAVGSDGATLATYEVLGAANVDWEDMARGAGSNGEPALFFADIGDNSRVRRLVQIYEVAEPVVDTTGATPRAVVPIANVYNLLYPARMAYDAETLFMDPREPGRMVIVTKDGNGGFSYIFVADPAPVAVTEMQLVAGLSMKDLATFPNGASISVTGGDIAPSGDRFVIRTYTEAFEWTLPEGASLAIVTEEWPLLIELPDTIQGEAIAYTADGLITTTEGVSGAVHVLRRAAA